ncbi:hypothetical protein TrRE_jg12804 [Triparma retinervis]|uniref:Uncharacterized protein n=1 Tax=Triparma retinervis TaxID=2557542 RepID=A0A9W6ZMR5_9STRA|nr:hypothetical protein TrRE_jg12804 [Triparma retinervis]
MGTKDHDEQANIDIDWFYQYMVQIPITLRSNDTTTLTYIHYTDEFLMPTFARQVWKRYESIHPNMAGWLRFVRKWLKYQADHILEKNQVSMALRVLSSYIDLTSEAFSYIVWVLNDPFLNARILSPQNNLKKAKEMRERVNNNTEIPLETRTRQLRAVSAMRQVVRSDLGKSKAAHISVYYRVEVPANDMGPYQRDNEDASLTKMTADILFEKLMDMLVVLYYGGTGDDNDNKVVDALVESGWK